jgi:hypothetical protein
MLTLFPDFRTAVFFGLFLAVSLANLFGFANWQPDQQLVDLALAIVSLVGAVLGILDGQKARRSRR